MTSIHSLFRTGESYTFRCRSNLTARYHDEYKTLIDDEFLTWTNPTGAEPVPSE